MEMMRMTERTLGARRQYGRKTLWTRVKEYKALYAMLLPAIVFFIVFSYMPIASGVLLSFKDYKFNMGIMRSPWVNWRYFENFFQYYQTPALIRNTVVVGLMKTVVEFPFPIALALMINEVRHMRVKRVVQTISYMPHFLSWVILATMIQRILAPNSGLFNQLCGLFGGDIKTYWLMRADAFYPIVFISDLWKDLGWNSIIYLAAITGVDPALYEAVRIDGGNKWHEITAVTLPGIRTTIGFLFILGIGGLVSSGYDQIYLLRTAGNMSVADTLDLYIIRIGLLNAQYGYAAAVGLIQGVVALALVLSTNYLSSKFTEVSIW
jgi:putative aldouronate transport system permease protein